MIHLVQHRYHHQYYLLYKKNSLIRCKRIHQSGLIINYKRIKILIINFTRNRALMRQDHTIELFRLKQLFKSLESANISGSVVTIAIPSKKSIVELSKEINEEKTRASNIKDKNNRNSVIEALNTVRQRLKLYQKTPQNGLVIFCGNLQVESSKTYKRVIHDFQPYKPINISIYSCGQRFKLDKLKEELLVLQPAFGFIVANGDGVLFATVEGNAKLIKKVIKIDLPNAHNKGGQSQVRFARLQKQSRHNYLRKICQSAAQCFLEDNKCNVVGIVLAGSADIKNDLFNSSMFDERLSSKVVKVVDVPQGFQVGLNYAIQKSCEMLKNTKYIRQKELLLQFSDHIAKADNLVTYGVAQTMRYLEVGAIKKIICYQNLNTQRVKTLDQQTGQASVIYLKPQTIGCNYNNPGLMYDQDSFKPLVEWLGENYKHYACDIQFISDKSPEGAQFVRDFGGFAGFLRYKVQIDEYETQYMENEDQQFI